MRKSIFALAIAALALGGCSTPSVSQSDAAHSESGHSEEHGHEEAEHEGEGSGDATEQAAAQTRLALTYDGGLLVMDAETLEVIADLPLDGFNRVNPAGDGRSVMVSTSGGFRVLDMGTWAQAHGDHHHYYTADPVLTDVIYKAEEPGHVVSDQGTTTLFDDGTGTVYVVPTADVAAQEAVREINVGAHHGVAVPLEGDLIITKEDRTGARVMDSSDQWGVEGGDCESIHGEGMVGDKVAFGCADGALVYHDGAFEKLTSPDDNGRMGTLVFSAASDVILSNYTPNYDGEVNENTNTKVALIDLGSDAIIPVELGTGYSFRSLARGDKGEAIILGADGKLHVVDPETATETAAWPVIDAWEVPEDWQLPRPAVFVADGTAFVTDPAAKKIYAVDIETGEVWLTGDLPQEVNELTGVTGFATSMAEQDEHASDNHQGHDHGTEEHDHETEGH